MKGIVAMIVDSERMRQEHHDDRVIVGSNGVLGFRNRVLKRSFDHLSAEVRRVTRLPGGEQFFKQYEGRSPLLPETSIEKK